MLFKIYPIAGFQLSTVDVCRTDTEKSVFGLVSGGGGEGSRTPVRKPFGKTFSGRILPL